MLLRRDYLAFIAGWVCLGVSIGSFISIFQNWVFLSSLTGQLVSIDSAIVMIYFSLTSIVSGIIGGFLVGKYSKLLE